MPKDLAALLVEEGAVPADVVERALARQRELGGALDTALLELGAIPEAQLASCLARAAELPQAPDSAWAAADPRARRVFPSRVAERHGLAPFALEGRELALVATYPVDLGLLDEISFMLSLHLTPHVGPEWRVRDLIHRIYGGPLPQRLAALSGAAPVEAHPPPSPAEERPAEPRAPPPTTAAAAAGFTADGQEPLEPLAAALAQALESVEITVDDGDLPTAGAPSPDDALAEAAEAAEADLPEEGLAEEPPQALDRSAPPHWTLDEARAVLAGARHRDEVVLIALRYARDFFEFAAMFAVTHDAVAGHDALGVEEGRDRARAVAIWASDPGIFRTVLEMQSPYLGPVVAGAAGTDAVLHGLARTPRTVLVYPMLLRDRIVCVLYADNGEAPVSARRLGDLLLFLSTVGGAFERIIRDRKGRGRRAVAPAPAVEPERAPEPPAIAAPVEPPFATFSSSVEEPAPDPQPPFEAVPAPEPPVEAPAEAPGKTGILWPAARGAAAEPAAPARGASATADSLAALEEQFFSGGPGDVAGVEEPAPEPSSPAPEPVAPPPAPTRTPPPIASPPAAATVGALADRALDADPAISAAACAALGNLRRDPAARQAGDKLRRALLSGISSRSTRAAHALGALRDVDAIPLLIQVLEASDAETAAAAADALAGITLQRLGPDARKWLTWWKANRGRGRADWLFSGLTHADRDTRVAASLELSQAAPPPVVYTADMPASDRERAARAWAGWWARSGHVL